jgi:hypothetical protein
MESLGEQPVQESNAPAAVGNEPEKPEVTSEPAAPAGAVEDGATEDAAKDSAAEGAETEIEPAEPEPIRSWLSALPSLPDIDVALPVIDVSSSTYTRNLPRCL